MDNRDFAAWCAAATKMIRYGPDRKAVSAELQAHLEDKYDALIAKGVAPEEAAAQTLEAMGSAAEIAPQLGAIHRPWLGYLYSITKFLGIAGGIVTVLIYGLCLFQLAQTWINSELYEHYIHHVETGYYCKPNVTVLAEGYCIRIPEAAVDPETETLFFQLEVTWLPWTAEFAAADIFWAVDSRGEVYESIASMAYHDPTRVIDYGSMSISHGGYVCYSMKLIGFDENAEWVELHYDRDGRDIVLRIDLSGGDG